MLSNFDPLVAEWFSSRFDQPTEPQVQGWREIAAGNDVLITAPTGSGKTLAAFLICLDELVRTARQGPLPNTTTVVYVSPLKALSNDVRRNLEVPLQQISELAMRRGVSLAPIRTAVRTGDTPAAERQRMLKEPPHVLVTTPESLFILATAGRSREILRSTRTVIVDEIHAVADDKRGSHLAITLARLEALASGGGRKPQRIGLSATVRPIEVVAEYLSPSARVVDAGDRRPMQLSVEVPNDELGAVATSEMWAEIYDRIAGHIQSNRTTLVFVNTRRLSERIAHALGERLGPGRVLPHHGSLSRALRHDAEARLKAGELRAVVATASLELGIDIGTVDLAIQVGTPRAIATALQRIGRSGHWIGAEPRGILFPTTRDELIECAALINAIRSGELERIEIPKNALDVMAQQIVAETAADTWREDDLFELIRAAYPYRQLKREDFDAVLTMLSEGTTTVRGRSGALLHRDQINHRVRGRRGARLAAITSGGAIPDNAAYQVIAEPDGKLVGALDEDFAMESITGDVFLLGTHSWRIRHVETGRVRVEDAQGAAPSIPFWLGEAPGRSPELSAAVSRVRETVVDDPDVAHEFLKNAGVDEAGAAQMGAYLESGIATLGALPSTTTVIAERFFDEAGGMQLILHAPFGSRINRAWGLALRKRFCRTFNFELQAAATDNGIVISLTDRHAFPLAAVFEFVKSWNVEDVLTQALLAAPMFAVRWRWNAGRALAILRFAGGRKVPAPLQRMRAEDLLAAVFPDQVACAENLSGPPRIPDHPLVNETIRNCLNEAMDVEGLKRVLAGIESGAIRTVAIETAQPSVFCHEIVNAYPYAYLDDAPIEERRTRAVQLRGVTRSDAVDAAGVLDQAAIEQVATESWPDVRDEDELHDVLLSLITLPPQPNWQHLYDVLAASGRAGTLVRNGLPFWFATERKAITDDAVAVLRGWMDSIGPATATELANRLALSREQVDVALAQLEGEGQILRGHFRTMYAGGEIEWCNRRILARIHRLTLGRLRREIEPVTAAQFHAFLFRWQHASGGARLHGSDGLLEVIRQMQGYEAPAPAWEASIFAERIAAYEPSLLDELCLSGEVMWARVSPHPALEDPERRIRPSRIAPISFFLRDDAEWLLSDGAAEPDLSLISTVAREVMNALDRQGASFFSDLTRATGHAASEIEDALWELVAAGLVTADGFENMRVLIDPKRRRAESRGRRARGGAGRWAKVPRTISSSAGTRIERIVRLMLSRWGVVFRDVMHKETIAPPWRDMLTVLRRMEARGEIRGGRFVAGFTGEQYALPEAVDGLRGLRREQPDLAAPDVAASDPLYMTGILLPRPVPAQPSTHMAALA